ncbi:MAG TPA: efflux RND transporter periplasmic adaptor subunit [Gemmataceae bacterium]|nr:efflux RND transporter periplasmic adaptor subunit [Gemmataceae bacterium]
MNWKLGLTGSALLAAAATALGFFWPFGARTQILRLPGVVEIQEIRLGSKIGGRVEKVEVVEGAIAEAGAPLVAFAMPEMEAQREQLQARVLSAAADLEKARNGARPEEKEAARQALATARAHLQLLKAGARSEEIREARSQFESAEADLRLAREEYERAERLLHQQSSSRAEFDTARASRERALGQSARTKAHLDMLLAGNRPEEILQADADMRKAQANYDLLLAGSRSEDIAAAEARLAEVRGKLHEIEANLLEAVVRAPERVLIEVLAVRKGDLVSPNQPILRVLRAADLWVKAYVPETDLGKVRLNQEVDVTVDAYPGQRFKGSVMQIASISEFTPRNVQSADERRHQVFGIKVHVADPQGVFKSGMAAEVALTLEP